MAHSRGIRTIRKPFVSMSLSLYCFAIVAVSSAQTVSTKVPPTLPQIEQSFKTPPDNCRIMMRWWWFGAAVTKPELAREIRAMKSAGIGGFEIQPVYPLALDDASHGIQNLPYLSNGFLDALRFAAETGRREGMRIDLTLTSGWPYGGAYLPVSQAAGMLRVVRVPISDKQPSIAVPSLSEGEKFLAVFQADGEGTHSQSSAMKQLPIEIEDGRLRLVNPSQVPSVAIFFIASRTGQQVKRPAVGASGFVLDHYDRSAIEDHLHTVADKLMQAFGTHPPYAVFSDSLEVYGSNWTGDFLNQFRKRRGYDLTPYLPALVNDIGPSTQAIRHDWGETLTELADENYLEPIQAWATAHGTRFRAQNYGIPPVTLSSNSLVDLPEGENFRWREFSETRWASSASHLYQRPVTSAEVWTWLHSPAFRATPLDMKAEADLDFLNGINQLIGHGWPYSPPSAGDPGWNFYAAGALNDHNPWWFVMPEIARYLQRVSFVLRQGKPDNEVAIFLPTDDAWANFTPDARPSVSEQMKSMLGPTLIPQVLDAGLDFDFIDASAIDKVGIPYKVLILPGVHRLPVSTYQKIQSYVQHGGIVLATRSLPSKAPGLLKQQVDSLEIHTISRDLFQNTASRAQYIASESQLSSALQKLVVPDVSIAPQTHDIGFVHRKLPGKDIYFLVNTSNQERTFDATFSVAGNHAEWWNPDSGMIAPAANGNRLQISLQPYESRILSFSSGTGYPSHKIDKLHALSGSVSLSHNWKVEFTSLHRSVKYDQLHSWTEDTDTRYYSGVANHAFCLFHPEQATQVIRLTNCTHCREV